jgi:hypothetical protein
MSGAAGRHKWSILFGMPEAVAQNCCWGVGLFLGRRHLLRGVPRPLSISIAIPKAGLCTVFLVCSCLGSIRFNLLVYGWKRRRVWLNHNRSLGRKLRSKGDNKQHHQESYLHSRLINLLKRSFRHQADNPLVYGQNRILGGCEN